MHGPQVKAGLTPLCSDAQEVEIGRRYFYWLFPRMKYMSHHHHRYVKFLKNESKDVPFLFHFVDIKARFSCWVNERASCTIQFVIWNKLIGTGVACLFPQKFFPPETHMRIKNIFLEYQISHPCLSSLLTYSCRKKPFCELLQPSGDPLITA